ncbi:hypothetical protein [Acidianus sp. HS-5]|uniref:hypothetical protein n=1 Tax=Acidianus sp. HS-5 TaxID=2886040 RepID=UPI001F3E05CE|nr:hypothetical protein [Acidianus sp. HS-5]BDC17645.1 hypothetical protein HS5_05350 [Acidianus sp. HS-5]
MCDKILIFQDADGGDRKEVINEIKSHLKELEKYVDKKIFIIFSEEIEEWIIPNVHKPSDELKRRKRYEKYYLPDYADMINFNNIQQLESFKDFIRALTDD